MMAVVSSSLNHGFLAGPSLINNMRPPSPKIQSHELQKKEQQEILTFAEALTIDQGTRNVSEPNSMCLRRGESSRESRNPSTQTGDQMPAAVSKIEEEIDQNYTGEEIHQINLESILNAEPGLEAEKIYVAVGKDLVESAHALTWALENLKIDGGSVILVHVMCTPRFIPTPVGKIPVNQVSRDMVDAFKKDEQKKINKWMKTYLIMCSRAKVKAEPLVVEKEEIPKGIVELISELRINKLIMGTTSVGAISRRMKMVSGKADYVQKHALNSCDLYVVCKEKLVVLKRRIENEWSHPSFSGSCGNATDSVDGAEALQTGNCVPKQVTEADLKKPSILRSPLWKSWKQRTETSNNSTPQRQPNQSAQSTPNVQPQASDFSVQALLVSPTARQENGSRLDELLDIGIPECCSGTQETYYDTSMDQSVNADMEASGSSSSINPENFQDSNSIGIFLKEDALEQAYQRQSCDEQPSALIYHHDDRESNLQLEALQDQLRVALREAENGKKEVRIEAEKRKKAELDASIAIQRVKDYEAAYKEAAKQKEDARSQLRMTRHQAEEITRQRDEAMEELEKMAEILRSLEIQVSEAWSQRNEAMQELQAARQRLGILEQQNDQFLHQRDDARELLRECLQPRQDQTPSISTRSQDVRFTEYSLEDLRAATSDFSDHFKIGEGGYGAVFKGEIQQKTVAIKILREDSLQGRREFQHEIDLLRNIRHPHLVRLMGACSERGCIVYEYMPNGSLQDRLSCKNGTPPLSWHTRFRIGAEVFSALAFLHNTKPDPIVHCDLKPANILLDENYVSRVSDFGLARLISHEFSYSRTNYRETELKGTFSYMDPDYQRTGEFTPRSDVYSLGIVLLQLLTGKPALGVAEEVQRATDNGKLEEVLDRSAGEWPFVQATQLAYLALHCTEMSRKDRPDLSDPTVIRIFDQLRISSSIAASTSDRVDHGQHSVITVTEEKCLPSFFLCPIFQEIMHDPHVAADGYTYEGEAIKGWLESGHDTSPMTNLKLSHKNLIPNRSLRSAIIEWLEKTDIL